jgi:XTP/dITP diphosphohydrolase
VPKLLLATRNQGKLRELRGLLDGIGIELDEPKDHPELRDVPETGKTFEENARLKALVAARATGLWSLGEDSGLSVDALGGQPGVQSARWAGQHGDDDANNARLLRELRGKANRRARYVCAMALASPDGEVAAVTQGTCEGVITEAPAGSGGFGYDPYFRPEGHDLTMAELARDEKAAISHRGRAARAMLPLLRGHVAD